MLSGRKHRHICTNLGKDRNSGHRITGDAGSGTNLVELNGVRFNQTRDFLFHIFLVCADFIDVLYAIPELCNLFAGYRPANGSLNLINGMLTALIDEISVTSSVSPGCSKI